MGPPCQPDHERRSAEPWGSARRQERTAFAGARRQWKVGAKGLAIVLKVDRVRTPAQLVHRTRAVAQAIGRGPVPRFAGGAAYLFGGKGRGHRPLRKIEGDGRAPRKNIDVDEPAGREPDRAEGSQRDRRRCRTADRSAGHGRDGPLKGPPAARTRALGLLAHGAAVPNAASTSRAPPPRSSTSAALLTPATRCVCAAVFTFDWRVAMCGSLACATFIGEERSAPLAAVFHHAHPHHRSGWHR